MTKQAAEQRSEPPGNKRHYRPREALRQLMVAEGIRLLVEDGMRGGENVTFARVIDRLAGQGAAPVTKGSVLGKGRLWRSQREFQLEVQEVFASRVGAFGMTTGGTTAAVAEALADVDLGTMDGRRQAIRNLCRRAGRANFVDVLGSREWRIWLAICATSMTTDDEREVGSAVRQGEMNSIEIVMRSLYVPFVQMLGLRPRPEYGEAAMHWFSLTAAALLDGLAIRHGFSAIPYDGIVRPSGPQGQDEPWHLYAVALEALVYQYYELVGD